MQLRQLEYLVALARERHFVRAAAACYVSQPSLSAAIRRLEHELGVPIVRRGRRYEGLTPEGEVVLAWAHRMLAERDALRQELSALGDGLTGTLRLASARRWTSCCGPTSAVGDSTGDSTGDSPALYRHSKDRFDQGVFPGGS